MHRKLIFKSDRCLACKACELVCSVVHSESQTLEKAVLESPRPIRRVKLAAGGDGIEALRCDQCLEPLCVFSCKSGALSRDADSGTASLDPERCVGCWMCFMVCPFGIRPDHDSDKALRCDVCSDRESPACADACPTGALALSEEERDAGGSDFHGRVVVIGASAAGVAACEAVDEFAPGASVTLVTKEDTSSYSRPLLPYLLSGRIDREKIFWRPEGYLEEQLGVEVLRGVGAAGLDEDAGRIELDNGAHIDYDRLIITTGAGGKVPDIPGIALSGVFAMRNLEDLDGMDNLAEKGRSAVVLGGGNVGLQTAEALLARGMEVTVVVRSPHLLSQMVDEEAGRRVGELFASRGVHVRTGRGVVAVEGEEKVTGVRFDNDEQMETDLVVVGKGISPNVEWLQETGLELGRGLVVDRCGRTNLPGIFAAGDCAETKGPVGAETTVSGIWPVAYEMGRAAGSAAVGIERESAGALGMNASRFFDVPIVSIGVVRPEKAEGCREIILARREDVYRKLLFRGASRGRSPLRRYFGRGSLLPSLPRKNRY